MTLPPLELDDSTYAAIKTHCATGDRFAEAQAFAAALEAYDAAWRLVPEPKTEWEASTWILAAIGDAKFLWGDMAGALEAFEYALHCPGGPGNAFIHLRLGEALFEEGRADDAANHMMLAYMGEGESVFEGDDPKYLAFLKTRAII